MNEWQLTALNAMAKEGHPVGCFRTGDNELSAAKARSYVESGSCMLCCNRGHRAVECPQRKNPQVNAWLKQFRLHMEAARDSKPKPAPMK